MQDEQFLINTLQKVIKDNIRHKDYQRVTDLKRKYTALITGEDMAYLMRRFDKHESEEMFDQRQRITNHVTKSVGRNLMKPLYKVPRSNSAKRVVTFSNDSNGERTKKFEEVLSHFWEQNPLDSWFNQRWIDLNGTDPNAWCVIEWADYNPTIQNAQPYPFEVSSSEAIYYRKDDAGNVQFLIAKTGQTDIFGENERAVYTIYGKEQIVQFKQMTPTEKTQNKLNTERKDKLIPIYYDNKEGVAINTGGVDWYIVNTFTHNIGTVPAFCIGFKRDMATDGRTYVSVIDDAEPILMKIVKANSEMDLTSALHVFPQKIQYANRCDAVGCNMGKMPDGSTCHKCGGTGYQIAKTAQDIIYLTMPRDKEEFLQLDNIVKYINPSVELVKWQDDYIKELTIRCKEAMYNSELFSKKQVAETATGKNIDLQNVYDSLYDMAIAFSHKWKFAVESIAKITDMDTGLICFYTFSKDFKLKSLTDLYLDMKLVSDSGADSFVKGGIQDDIAGILYSEDPIRKGKYETEKAFYPFTGKSEKEIMFAVSTDAIPERVKVLYLNYGWIMDELFMESADKDVTFYEMNRDMQRGLIDKKIKKIIGDMPSANDMIDETPKENVNDEPLKENVSDTPEDK